MYYWRYPLQGVGSHTDSYINYGTLSANFGTTTYNWNAMTNSCVGTDSAIATLIYHCGVAVNMDYGVSGSSAAMTSAVTAFKNYFKYTAVSSANKSSYTWAAWDTLIASQLNLHYAVIYSGQDPTAGGHAWVCDGYQFNGSRYFFHFNWGWSGSSDGYYYTDNLNPSGMDFYEYNSIIYNIYPPSGYPYYCSGTTETLTSPVGTFEDGSGPATDYQNNDNCSWLIYPYCGGHINLTFNNFSTAPGDSLIVYNGSNASAPVLHAYCGIDTGSALPTAISSTSPTVFLKFVSDGSGTAAGWKISYTTTFPVFCSSLTTLTAASGSFSNGSGACNYDNNTNCKWLIKPTGAATVTLNFSSFNTQKTNDYVKITDNASHVLGIFSGDTIPPAVTSTNGQMLVMFTTDASVTAPGWSASYSSTSGLEEYNSIKELAVYPNPAKDEMHISFIAEGIDHATLEIIDLAGQIVYLQKVNCSNGAFSKDINISDYAKGIYNLRILTSREAVNKKIVVE
jgi:hypothetical protein